METYLLYAIGIAIAVMLAVFVSGIVLLRKISSRIKRILSKMDFFEEKIESEAKRTIVTYNHQFADLKNDLRELQNKLEVEEELTEDELYETAENIARERGTCSSTLLQRMLKVGYARASRLMDMLEENGVITPADGANPRLYIGDENE